MSAADLPRAGAPGVAVCDECDWVMETPALSRHESAHCPRCARRVATHTSADAGELLAWSTAALIMLGLSLVYPFVRFETQGAEHTIVLIDTFTALLQDPYLPVALTIALCVVALPAVYLMILAYLAAALVSGRSLPGMRFLAVHLHAIEPWIMSDVFVAGVLVALIKVLSLADIALGTSFTAFCAYSLLLLTTISRLDTERLWEWIGGTVETPSGLSPGRTAARQHITACPVCEAVFQVTDNDSCPRCGRPPHGSPRRRQSTALALIITAAILYIPAMSYPVMVINQFGHADPQTILGGAWYLVSTGSWPIGAVIFLASVVVPIGKILALGWLCLRAHPPVAPGRPFEATRLYRLIEAVGRWSMIDVFVVAVLAALIQAGQIVSVAPGPGITAFGAVVIVTMLAAVTFDPRAIWLQQYPEKVGDA